MSPCVASTGRERLSPLLTELVGNMTFVTFGCQGWEGLLWLSVSCVRAVPCPCHMALGGSGRPPHLPQHRLTWPSSSSPLGGVLALALCLRTAWVWEVLPLDLCWGFQVSLCHFSVSASLHSVVPLGKRRTGTLAGQTFSALPYTSPGAMSAELFPAGGRRNLGRRNKTLQLS